MNALHNYRSIKNKTLFINLIVCTFKGANPCLGNPCMNEATCSDRHSYIVYQCNSAILDNNFSQVRSDYVCCI